MNMRALLTMLLLTVTTAASAAYNPTNPNGQATMANSQPVVIASNQTALPVTGTFWQATQPVSGTFWQATQPVSGPLTDVQLRATAVPVSLASVPTHAVTQSGAWTFSLSAAIPAGTNNIGDVDVLTLPSIPAGANVIGGVTQSGTWNVGTVTNLSQLGGTAISMNTGVRDAGTQRVTIATNDSVPVTGIFWQATQPVSGPLTDTQLRASAVPVSLASLPSLAAGTALVGKVGIDQTTPGTTNAVSLSHVGATAVATGNGVAGTGVQRVTVASDNTAFPIKVSDGTNTSAVKAASTAAAATDPALVVAVSPNNEVGVTELPAAAASADGLANPTVTQIGAAGLLFNGTTWDRQRNNVDTTTGDSGAKTATFGGNAQTNYNARGAYITVIVSAVSGTTPTMTAQLQFSPNSGTTWYNLGPASAALSAAGAIDIAIYPTNFSQTPGATPANLAVSSAVSMQINAPLPRTWRVVYTITGTTPSFTITGTYVNHIL